MEQDPYLGLQDIDEVQPFDAGRDQVVFDDLREVLARHGVLDRFGICLLHKHFDVQPGERMVESCDVESRTLTVRPTAAPLGADQSLVQTNWRFDPSGQNPLQLCFADCLVSNGKHREIHKKNYP